MPKSNQKLTIKLLCILLAAFTLRVYGMNWDSGFHMHPDERMIIMVADRISFFSNLNPHFFNYGSLPIYLLKGISQLFHTATYQGMLNTGRIMSILFDMGTTFLIYRIGFFLFRKKETALFSSFLYAIAFFPIQNSHFFTVDILFTFLSTLLIYLLLKRSSSFLIGITFAALLATKFTAVIFLPIIFFVIYIKKKFSSIFYLLFSILLFSFLFMPYAFLDLSKFYADISLQLKMNSNPYIFPYTLQYVNTLPYWYYLKNIILWGLGPVISILSIIGLYQIQKRKNMSYISFYIAYFLIIGFSAVKFMRYMLPLYPFFAVMAGYGLYKLKSKNSKLKALFLLAAIGWSLMFVNIYSQPNTRVTASEWILKNIPAGSSLAVEYWDDYLPIHGSEKYRLNELHLYDLPDNNQKWDRLNTQLQESDYIIIASNRLYVPLQKLASYPKTAVYYKKLFSNELGFEKVAEFSVKPGFTRFFIDDSSADESFTVFDHPKVMIFKKND